MLKKIIIISVLGVAIIIFISFFIDIDFQVRAADNNLAERLKGRILLEVEHNGEAWYVNPADKERYYLGNPQDAFRIIKKLGIGITSDNLEKISAEPVDFSGLDSDRDGLSDNFEEAIGTNKNNKDTDEDGYDDRTEVLNNYSPKGRSKLGLDNKFAGKQKGKIFLQVEHKGEAWYINPLNGKRYFLNRPADAFGLMRILGLGVKDSDLEKIKINNSITVKPPESESGDQSSDNQDISNNQSNNTSDNVNNTNNTSADDQTTFENKFKICETGANYSIPILDSMVYYVEIIGTKEGLCEVKSKYTKMPNPKWLNKEMTCLLDNSKSFEIAIQDMSKCSGELYDLIQGG